MPKEMDKRDAVLVYQTKYNQNDLKNLPNIVEYLINCREDNINVYVLFKGHRLYSADVTMENAFLDVFGYTFDDIRKVSKGFKGATEEQKERLKAILDSKAKNYREKQRNGAKEILFKFDTIKEVVDYLQDKKRDGENVYVVFKGCKLYSSDVTYDSAREDVEKTRKEIIQNEDKDMKTYTPGKTKIQHIKGAKKIEEEDPEL